MENWIFIFLVILLFCVWLWLHYRSKLDLSHKQHQSTHPSETHVKTYHATSIHLCSAPCKCVLPLKGKRFLANEVTALPVQGCTNQKCTCTYVHHEDRRSGDDRRVPSISMANVYSAKEHRMRKERRKQSFA